MASAVVLQTQISAILDVLTKAAVAEISQLIQEDSVVLHLEIKRREDEIEGLKKRLQATEKELKKAQATADKCSVGVQVEMLGTDLMPSRKGSSPGSHLQTFNTGLEQELKEEKPQLTHRMPTPSQHTAEQPSAAQAFAPNPGKQQPQACDEDEFSRLEFEMKMEQVEELVDQELSLQRADFRMVHAEAGSDHKTTDQMWSPVEDDSASDFGVPDACTGLEQYQQVPTEPCAEPVSRPHTHLPTNTHPLGNVHPLWGRAPAGHARSKPFRCEECGKGFTQRTRLITHKRIHTGEKPYHCQLCGKMFSRQDNCLRHVRLHSGQRW